MQFACNGELASPGNCSSFRTYGDMLEWANRAFKLGLSSSDRKRAHCEVIPRRSISRYTAYDGCDTALDSRVVVNSTDDWSSAYQYFVFSMVGAKASPVVLNYVAFGELLIW
jgi:hypothetical protein